MGFGYTGSYGWLLYKLLLFVLLSYIFSLIFWGTKKWLDSKSKKRKK